MLVSTLTEVELCIKIKEVKDNLEREIIDKIILPGKRKIKEIYQRTKMSVPIKPRTLEFDGNDFIVSGRAYWAGGDKFGLSLEAYTIVYNSQGDKEAIMFGPSNREEYSYITESYEEGIYVFKISNHFLKRYRERFLEDKTLSIEETMVEFFRTNSHVIAIGTESYPPDLPPDFMTHKGEASTVLKLGGGVAFSFAVLWERFMLFNLCTCVTDQMLKENQEFMKHIDNKNWLYGKKRTENN